MKGGRWRLAMGLGLGALVVLGWGSWSSSASAGGAASVGLVESADGARAFNASYAQQLLHALCRHYRQDRVSGDYCNRLCFYPAHKVLDFRSEKKQVITLQLGGQKTVLKARQPFLEDFDEEAEMGKDQAAVEKALVRRVNEALGLGWPAERGKQLLELLWPAFRRDGSLREADRRSLAALTSQPEYLIFSVLPLARVFPKVLGSCGHFYVVEHVVPFKLKSYYSSLRAKILVHLMGTLKLFYEFLNEPLHWCDVKFENLGLSAEYPKRFLVMDGEGVATESGLRRRFASTSCASDADCRWGDCHSRCNVSAAASASLALGAHPPRRPLGRCAPGRANDNVGVFCAKLVHQLFGSFWSSRNRYLAACHSENLSPAQRLRELRLVWAWSLSDV